MIVVAVVDLILVIISLAIIVVVVVVVVVVVAVAVTFVFFIFVVVDVSVRSIGLPVASMVNSLFLKFDTSIFLSDLCLCRELWTTVSKRNLFLLFI
jgi:hypothetical protein